MLLFYYVTSYNSKKNFFLFYWLPRSNIIVVRLAETLRFRVISENEPSDFDTQQSEIAAYLSQ